MTEKKQLSKEGELRFASEFTRKGWNIFFPYGEDSPIDLLIEKEGIFKRIQVKSKTPCALCAKAHSLRQRWCFGCSRSTLA